MLDSILAAPTALLCDKVECTQVLMCGRERRPCFWDEMQSQLQRRIVESIANLERNVNGYIIWWLLRLACRDIHALLPCYSGLTTVLVLLA